MSRKTVPPIETLIELVRYEPNTGKLFWIERARELFPTQRACSTWNKKFAGAEAFTTPNSQGYTTGKIFRVREAAHRVAFALANGRWPIYEVDHINGVRTDNRIENLREVTTGENGRNCKRRSDNTSGFTGVRRSRGRYIAELQCEGKRVWIGSFATLEEAAKARKDADREYGFHENHGRSALVDVPAVESEPVAWTSAGNLDGVLNDPKTAWSIWGKPNGLINVPLYAHPRRSQSDEASCWPIETDDQVEALARDCDWDNRKYMTPADYSIWCERMRRFARLAVSTNIQPSQNVGRSGPVAWRYRHDPTVSWSYSETRHPRSDLLQEPLFAATDGWALVPAKMTAAMINAWSGGLTVTTDEIALHTSFQEAWARVLSAALPTPSALSRKTAAPGDGAAISTKDADHG